MTRNDDGIYKHVVLINYENAVVRPDTDEYDVKPDEGYAVHIVIKDGGHYGCFDFTTQHNVIMWRWSTRFFFMKMVFMISSALKTDTFSS